ncbi:hypothetical protein quinque_003921 [Culex quinquefasciatus]
MPVFKLESYPFVCRMCLKPEQSLKMTPLDTEDEGFEGCATFEEFLSTITFEVVEERRHLFPRSICSQCKDSLKNFARFRAKTHNVHLFMNALAELRDLNTAPIKNLFQTQPDTVRSMLTELDLCSKADCLAEDLIEEFPQFQIAQLPATLKDTNFNEEFVVKIEVEPEKLESDALFIERCPLEELVEPKIEIVDETNQEVRCELLEPTGETFDLEVKQTKKRGKYKTKTPKEPLQCPKCPYTTTRKTHYNSHQRTHLKRESRSYPCHAPGCTEKYPSRVALQKHMVEAKHTACVCEICGYQSSSNGQLKDHLVRFHGNDRLKCEYCQKIFKVKQDLQEHVKAVHLGEIVFKCETCGTEYRSKTALRNHQARHSDVYNFPCQQCDKKFKVKILLHKHIQSVHKEASLECEHCFQMFHFKFKLLDHIENVHKIRMRFFCDVCVASFYSQDDLATHKARHDSPKNLECGRCLIVFHAQEQLSHHVCITYRDDYVCCGKDLRHHVQYNRHMIIEHGVKMNVRVKPNPDLLLGHIRTKRKRVLSCPKCKIILPTRTQKKKHQETCIGVETQN